MEAGGVSVREPQLTVEDGKLICVWDNDVGDGKRIVGEMYLTDTTQRIVEERTECGIKQFVVQWVGAKSQARIFLKNLISLDVLSRIEASEYEYIIYCIVVNSRSGETKSFFASIIGTESGNRLAPVPYICDDEALDFPE